MHPKGYTKEMIKEILGTSWPTKGDKESGNQERRRKGNDCLLYTSPSPRDRSVSRMPSSA